MFDNPKKELERLEQQLLAAEEVPEAAEDFDDIYDEVYDEFDEEEPYDELQALINGTPMRRFESTGNDISRRAAGFDAEEYEMDSDRYVPAPRKKGIGCLASFALTLALSVIALVLWWLRRLL